MCSLILYIHGIYGILYMYNIITKYGCVFLKLGESIYVPPGCATRPVDQPAIRMVNPGLYHPVDQPAG